MSVKKSKSKLTYREWLDNATFGIQGDNEEYYNLAKAALMLYAACKEVLRSNIIIEGHSLLEQAIASAEGRI